MAKVLVINPGAISGKIAVYNDLVPIFERTVRHEEESGHFRDLKDHTEFILQVIRDVLSEEQCPLESIDAIIARGGYLRPLEAGTYRVNQQMIEDLIECRYGTHASNIGAILAASLAKENPVPIMIADPIVVDELCPEARYTGHPDYERTSIFHALNTRAVAKRYAEGIGKPYEALNLIMVHMGGGLSIGAHRHGRVIDVNNCLDGEGAFSTERAGSMPIRDMLDLCYSGEYTREEAFRKLIGNGGLYAYLGTKDGFEIQNRIEAGDEQAIEVIRAQAYQVAKEIGALAAVLKGDVDAILLTGGLAYLEPLTEQIKEHVSFIAPVELFPGEDELGALALAAYEVMNGERELKEYA